MKKNKRMRRRRRGRRRQGERRREKKKTVSNFWAMRIPSPTQFCYAFVITLAIHLEQEISILSEHGSIIALSISQSV